MQTPVSKLKNVEACSNWNSLRKFTPATITPLAEDTPARIAESVNHIHPINLDDVTPAKNSSSKRVTLIKQEKK